MAQRASAQQIRARVLAQQRNRLLVRPLALGLRQQGKLEPAGDRGRAPVQSWEEDDAGNKVKQATAEGQVRLEDLAMEYRCVTPGPQACGSPQASSSSAAPSAATIVSKKGVIKTTLERQSSDKGKTCTQSLNEAFDKISESQQGDEGPELISDMEVVDAEASEKPRLVDRSMDEYRKEARRPDESNRSLVRDAAVTNELDRTAPRAGDEAQQGGLAEVPEAHQR